MNDSAVGEAVRRVQLAFPQIYYACHAHHRQRHSTSHGLSDRDLMYLGHLTEDRGVYPRCLASHLGISPSTLSAFLGRAEELGYLTRRACSEDRRQVELFLTDAGRRVLCQLSVLDAERLGPILAGMPPSELRQAVEGLTLLADACRQARMAYEDRSLDSELPGATD